MAALPPPIPQPPKQSPTDDFFEGFNHTASGVWNDFRILFRIVILAIMITFIWEAVFFIRNDEATLALLDLPIVWVLWRYQKRFASPRR